MTLIRQVLRGADGVLGRRALERLRQQDAALVLLYHRVAPEHDPTYPPLPPAVFERHCAFVRDAFEVIRLGELADRLRHGRSLKGCCVMTFDDGYRSIREIALPWLVRFGYPAVMFVPTDFVGGSSSFDGDEPEEAICDWAELRDLQRWGVSIQSHAASHRPFSKLDPVEQEREVVGSKAVLEAELGAAVAVLAYPYGDPGADPEDVADDGRQRPLLVVGGDDDGQPGEAGSGRRGTVVGRRHEAVV